jgi:hypothetical protein
MNNGYSSRASYDRCAYPDKLNESVGSGHYRLSVDQIHNCGQCNNVAGAGPRGRNQVSTAVGHPPAASQALVDVESVLSNRNVKISKCKTGKINPIGITDFKLEHLPVCNQTLAPLSSRLSYPAANYRDTPINRFMNLPKNPQVNIFYDWSVNTSLEMKDNFVMDVPRPWRDVSQPTELQGQGRKPCKMPGAVCE